MALKLSALAPALLTAMSFNSIAYAAVTDTKAATIDDLQAQITALQEQVNALKAEQQNVKAEQQEVKQEQHKQALISLDKPDDEDGIKLGGAVRFQYSNNSYSHSNKHQKGGIEFDTFRLNADGKIGDVILSAEWRWYEYMTTLHHAWVGYNFDDNNQVQVGLARIPFGNQAFNSHSFFFSSNYYLGLEDNYAFGAAYLFDDSHWNAQLGFFKNSARGVGGSNENYSFDLVGVESGGSHYKAGTSNTGAARLAYRFQPTADLTVETGGSALYGGLYGVKDHDLPAHSLNSDRRIGNYGAYALHTDIDYKRWNFQLQATHYDYRFNNDNDTMLLGAYAGDYNTPTRGHTYTANLAYHQPVAWGPITGLDLYNDYSLISHKSNAAASTYMNVTGVGVSAGGVYAYLDYINARNQPFIGGDFAGTTNTEKVQHRFNMNIGYYF